jgi:recombination associated protein RdgC
MSLFKSAVIYRIGPDWAAPTPQALELVLQSNIYVPCGATEEVSSGWVPVRGEAHAPLVESINGQLVLKLEVERKSVPAGAVRIALEARCTQIELQRGSKPGRKEVRELKDDIYLELLPRAFSKKSSHFVWVDVKNRTIVVGASSYKSADPVIQQVIEAFAQAEAILPIAPLSTATTPTSAMSVWLTAQEAPVNFSVDRDLELKSFDDSKASVRYSRHNLELAEIVQHITDGKVPVQLALTWKNRVSFVLSADLVLRKLELLDIATEVAGDGDGFDGDVVLTTSELQSLIPDLVAALDGESQELPTS